MPKIKETLSPNFNKLTVAIVDELEKVAGKKDRLTPQEIELLKVLREYVNKALMIRGIEKLKKEGFSKDDNEIIKELEGDEVYYNDDLVGIEYPFVVKKGKKIKLNDKEWKNLINQYFKDSNNDGYWETKYLEDEFKTNKSKSGEKENAS